MGKTWDPNERTIKAILDAYLLPDEKPPAQPVAAVTGKPSGDPAAAPADPPAADPAAAGSGTPAPAHVPATQVVCPRWDGPDYLNLPNAEDKKHELPPTGMKGPQDRNDEELTADEAKQLRIDDAYKANAAFVLMYGFKMPFVRRLDPSDKKTQDLVAFIQEVRGRLPKVPVAGLAAADPGGAPMTGDVVGAPAAAGANPRIRLNHYNSFQVQFNVTYSGTIHDVTKLAEWTVDNADIASVTAGLISSKKTDGSATVTAKWKGVTKQIDVDVDVKPNPSRSAVIVNRGGAPTLGAINWTSYKPEKGLVGWVYDDDPAEMPPAFYGQLRKFVESIPGGDDAIWNKASILRKLSQEGGSGSINTYDGMVLTLGSGNAAAGAVNFLAEGCALSPEARKLLYLAGLSVELMPQYKTGDITAHCVKMVDLSDPAKPRILYFDNVFHFYGWANGRFKGPKGAPANEPIKPAKMASTTPTFEVTSYAPDAHCLFVNAGGPNPFTIFRHFTPATKPADESFAIDKNNMELMHAMIALRSCTDPPIGPAFFENDWRRSVGHTNHGLPTSSSAKAGAISIGLRSAYVFCGMIAHNWGFGVKVAGHPEKYLLPDEIAELKKGSGTDPYRNALVCKAAARAVAVLIEKVRVSTAFATWIKKKTPITFEALEGMKSAWWGYGRVMNYWHEMIGEPSVKGERVSKRLDMFKKKCKPADLAKLFADAGITEEQFDAAAKDDILTIPKGTTFWDDGFDIRPKTDSKFDFRNLYAKDYSDGPDAKGKVDTGNAYGSYKGNGTAFFCVGPKKLMSDLPALVKAFDRGFDLINVDTKTMVKQLVGTWKITNPSSARVGKFVLTDQLGDFLDNDRKPSASPVFFDSDPLVTP